MNAIRHLWLGAALLLLAACSGLPTIGQDDTGARALVEIATLAAIEQSDDRADAAARVIAAATEARTWLDLEGVTLDEIATRVRARIVASDLELSQKAALNTLVNILAAEISAQVDVGQIDPATRVTVNKLLGWVVSAAQAYTG